MNQMSKKQIRVDQAFDKALKEHVVKNIQRTLCFSIRGGKVVISGEKESVEFVEENMEQMTVEELVQCMEQMESQNLSYKSTEKIGFPPMKNKFKGCLWKLEGARVQLSLYMNIIGFGKGGTKKYRVAGDEPDGWPDEHSFVDFQHPSSAKLDTINDIIGGILDFHGYDANNHPFLQEEPEEPPAKRKNNRHSNNNRLDKKSEEEGEEDVEDDLEEDEEDTEKEEEGENSVDLDAPTPYEQLRQNNIKERENLMRAAGVLPHSEVIRGWRK